MQKLWCLTFLFFIACAVHEKKIGGGEIYKGEELNDLNKEELTGKFIQTLYRDNPIGFHEKAFHAPSGSLKRIGFIFFETTIQSTRDGLSSEENFYFTNHAKQIYTETLYKKWQEKVKKWDPLIEVVMVEDTFVPNKTYLNYTEDFVDYTTLLGESLLPEDVQYLVKGKNTTNNSLMMPRKFKDLSLMSAPVAILLTDTKPTDYHEYWLNDLAQELKLDALLVVYSEIDWNRQTTEALDPKKIIPEGAKIKIDASITLPFKKYQNLLTGNGFTGAVNPGTTVFRAYTGKGLLPIKIAKPEATQTVKEAFDEQVWNKVFTAYDNMAEMITSKMQKDLVGTLQ